ncbi:MAG TPA: hypothetical protein VK017_00355 [Sphingobacterium sp.]|nr:hypothetical protein [Sphingobacterium sp.]
MPEERAHSIPGGNLTVLCRKSGGIQTYFRIFGAMMTIEELKNELLGRTYPERVQISPDQVVLDAETFLRIQFIELEAWKKELEKCPAYLRLVRFRDAVNAGGG